jgi:SagB-type dehydrogenase family enzyme
MPSLHLKLDPEIEIPHGALSSDLLARLTEGATEDDLVKAYANALPELFFKLQQLRRGNCILYELRAGEELLATVHPIRPGFEFAGRPARALAGTVLSRFAFLRRDGDSLVLESPLSPVRIVLENRALALLGRLHDREAGPRMLAHLLQQCGMLETKAERQFAKWEFHDLLFHAASRTGRGEVGATYRFKDAIKPLAACKAPMSSRRIALPSLDLEATARADPSLTAVIESRRSQRGAGNRSLTRSQLSHFLFRTAHYRSVYRGEFQELVRRPMPAGGGIHELEFYVSVNACRGLRKGLYHYHSREHALYRLSPPAGTVEQLLASAQAAWGQQTVPDVLITLATRFDRIAWKYAGMAYRTTLLNAGVAIQTMYLVATAMNLSACAIGNGDPAVFAKATGLNPAAETSVAEFALSAFAEPGP